MSQLVRHQPTVVSGRPLQQPPAQAEEVNYYYAEQEQNKHLRDYWNILRKHMRHMVPIFCGTVALGLIINFLLPTQYTARSTVKIEPQNPTVTGVGGVQEIIREGAQPGPYDYYQTQFVLLKSGPLAARVIKNLGLESNPSFKPSSNILKSFFNWIVGSIVGAIDGTRRLLKGERPPERPRGVSYELGVAPHLVGRYLNYLKVSPIRNTRLVDITFETPDPKLSQDLANGHATSFIQMVLESRFNVTQEARDFLRKKLTELRENVQKAENALNHFRKEYGVVSIEKGENIVVDRLMDINKELTRIRAERIQAESLYQMTRNKNNQHLSQVLNSPLIMQLKASLANLETEKGRLLSIYTSEHPRVQELNQQIGEARRGLNAEISNIVHGIESSFSAARAREEALEVEAKKQQDAALALKQVGVDYSVLNEEVVVNRGLYENVLKRLNETSVGNDLAAVNIEVTQRAELPLSPSSPRTLLNLMISAFLGLLFAVGYAFFSEYMDATVNTPEGVWSAVSLATLGVVPHLESLQERYHPVLSQSAATNRLEPPRKTGEFVSNELVVARNQLSLIAESYRTIRTALLLSQAEHPPKVILLTSPCPGEGKTVTTLNLGVALAQSGNKVLVIDADLRKGRCHKLLNLQNQGGLANVLTGHFTLERSIKETPIRNLHLLPRGVLPPNPADLLMSQKMRDVLRESRNAFDFILMDSPPVIAVSDAAVLSVLCDGVLLVFNGQQTTTGSAQRAVERLERVGASILGVILNGIDIRDPDYDDYRSYYPSYYASVQAETKPTNKGSDGIVQNVEDVARVMEAAGVHGVKAESVPEFERKGEASSQDGKRLVPRHFFDRMVLSLSEPLGPVAHDVVKHQVSALQESMESFPLSRVWELAQLVSQEILDNRQKVRFLRSMSEEIRSLQSI